MTLLTPEQEAREQIDALLEDAGWSVQSLDQANLNASRGVAVAEFHLDTGFADYVLFVDKRPIGVIEAKSVGTTLSGVESQAARYSDGLPRPLQERAWCNPLPFLYQSTGVETFFTNEQDPNPRSRRVFAFHKPDTLAQWAQPEAAPQDSATLHVSEETPPYGDQVPTLRARLRRMPLNTRALASTTCGRTSTSPSSGTR
jgi:type I restriction enzyme R subunit